MLLGECTTKIAYVDSSDICGESAAWTSAVLYLIRIEIQDRIPCVFFPNNEIVPCLRLIIFTFIPDAESVEFWVLIYCNSIFQVPSMWLSLGARCTKIERRKQNQKLGGSSSVVAIVPWLSLVSSFENEANKFERWRDGVNEVVWRRKRHPHAKPRRTHHTHQRLVEWVEWPL